MSREALLVFFNHFAVPAKQWRAGINHSVDWGTVIDASAHHWCGRRKSGRRSRNFVCAHGQIDTNRRRVRQFGFFVNLTLVGGIQLERSLPDNDLIPVSYPHDSFLFVGCGFQFQRFHYMFRNPALPPLPNIVFLKLDWGVPGRTLEEAS
jgi:hypothetical protein